MSDKEMESFVWDLGKLGFVWQFITLAGFHSDGETRTRSTILKRSPLTLFPFCTALIIDTFAKQYATRGMYAYVSMIQRQERENKVETLAHQVSDHHETYPSLDGTGLLPCLAPLPFSEMERCQLHGQPHQDRSGRCRFDRCYGQG